MATHDVGKWLVEDFPETITLGPGELRIIFDGALDLAARMLELSQAMTNDWMTVKRCLEEGPPPSSVRQARPRSRLKRRSGTVGRHSETLGEESLPPQAPGRLHDQLPCRPPGGLNAALSRGQHLAVAD